MKKLLLILCTVLWSQYSIVSSAAGASAAGDGSAGGEPTVADFPTFTDAKIAFMPSLTGITADQVMEVFAGDVDINGRRWGLRRLGNNDHLREAIEGGPTHFTVNPLADDQFACPLFDLDKNAVWRMRVYIQHHEKTFDDGSPLAHTLEFITQLTSEEQENPFLAGLKGRFSFEGLDEAGKESEVFIDYLKNHQLPIMARCLKNPAGKEEVIEGVHSL